MKVKAAASKMVALGQVSGVFGVRGWVKVFSHTSPSSNILSYSPWYLGGDDGWEAFEVLEGQSHGKGLIVRLAGLQDREQAANLVGRVIAVDRAQLPEPEAGEYYWTDLQGLRVQTAEGVELGRVDHLFETGANDVLVVQGDRERLVPYIWGEVIRSVDLEAGLMVVDWDPDF
jgi:16S rRNA processing protein RimM